MKVTELSLNEASPVSAEPDKHADLQPAEETGNTHESISKLAYALWEQRGRPTGSSEQDWIEAQQEILKPLQRAAGAGS